ncbi:MAG: hypothetical protein RR754_08085, partial [Oscillospiraceae bacterium]
PRAENPRLALPFYFTCYEGKYSMLLHNSFIQQRKTISTKKKHFSKEKPFQQEETISAKRNHFNKEKAIGQRENIPVKRKHFIVEWQLY